MTNRSVRHIVSAAALVALAGVASAQQGPFTGHVVVRVYPKTPAQLQQALALTEDVWTCETVGNYIDMRLEPTALDAMRELAIDHQVIVEDVQSVLDAEWARLNQPAKPEAGWYDDFHPIEEYYQHIDALVAGHGALATKSSIGTTLEGRDIPMIRVKGTGGPATKPIVVINGCQHAREWVSPSTVMYTMESMLTGYGVNSEITAALDSVEFAFVPIVNGDGYAYTWTPNNRLWRKNRRDNGGGCFGVDTNRNWGFQWGLNSGSSGSACSDTYRGPAPFSEPETQAISNAITSLMPNVRAHIDVHSYGQWILSPWGWTLDAPQDLPLFDYFGEAMEAAILSTPGGEVYTSGQSSILLYLVSGGSKDWTYATHGAVGWTIELRPIGSNPGFVIDPSEIIPTGEEYLSAMLTLADQLSVPSVLVLGSALPSSATSGSNIPAALRVYDSASEHMGVKVWTRSGSGAFTATSMTATGGGWYGLDIPVTGKCGGELEVYFEAELVGGGSVTYPEGGAAAPLSVSIVGTTIAYEEALETGGAGWVVGAPGDTATSGIWSLNNPESTAAQPEDDHTPTPGVNCFVTDYRAGTSVGTYDVDAGATTLTSAGFDASDVFDIIGDDPRISYWRWYSNNQGSAPNQDSMPISISNDGGQSWTQVELVTENAGAWVRKEVRIADFVTPTANMKLRFVARDDGAGSIVEAAVDDVTLTILGCPRHPADMNADGVLDFFDFLEFQNLFSAMDPLGDFNKDGVFDFFDFLAFQNSFLGG